MIRVAFVVHVMQVAGAEVALVAGLGAPEHATTLLTVDR